MSREPTILSSRDRYIDLIKRTLTYSLWPEPPRPLTFLNHTRPRTKRYLISTASRAAAAVGVELVQDISVAPDAKEEGRYWPGYAHTMIGIKRLDNLQFCVETALHDDIPGDLIETGVWRGGACILMRAILAAEGVTDRRVFVADSFEGLPAPDEERYPADRGDRHHTRNSALGVSREDVEANFRQYGLLDDQVVFVKGWFKDTLPTVPIERLAILRVDGDMYESTMDAMRNLYPKLSPGGFLIIDDYALTGCKAAITDYRAEHAITSDIVQVDWTGAYWRKDEWSAPGPTHLAPRGACRPSSFKEGPDCMGHLRGEWGPIW